MCWLNWTAESAAVCQCEMVRNAWLHFPNYLPNRRYGCENTIDHRAAGRRTIPSPPSLNLLFSAARYLEMYPIGANIPSARLQHPAQTSMIGLLCYL